MDSKFKIANELISNLVKLKGIKCVLIILSYNLIAGGALAEEENKLNLREFQDCPNCPTMVVLPKGSFEMGAQEHYKNQFTYKNVRRFSLTPVKIDINYHLAVGKFEIWAYEYYQCYLDGKCEPLDVRSDGYVENRSLSTMPANDITWKRAHDYINWLSEKTGRQYRLLSESEWEYATRGGTDTEFWWGDEFDPTMAVTSESSGFSNTGSSIERLKANPFGLYGTLGNLSEWVLDCRHQDSSSIPKDGQPKLEDADCSKRVLRGGSFLVSKKFATNSSRASGDINGKPGSSIGFRIATNEINENE